MSVEIRNDSVAKRQADGVNGPRKLRKINHKIAKILKTEKSSLPIDTLTTSEEPLTQEDVVYFQKEAIYRLLNLQYKKTSILTNSLDEINTKYTKLLVYNSILIQWWFQILDNLKLLFNLDLDTISSFNDEILISLNKLELDVDDEDLNSNLQVLQTSLSKLLSSLIQTLPAESNVDTIISLENEISNLSVLKNSLTDENNHLKLSINKLNDKLDSITMKYERATSKSLKRVKSVESAEVKEESRESSNVPMEKNAQSSTDIADLVNKSIIEDLNIKIEEIQSKNNTLQSQLEEKLNYILSLERSIADLNYKRNNLTDEDLANISVYYKSVIEDNKKLKESMNEIQNDKKKLESQIFEIESKFSINKSKIEAKIKSELENNTNYISKLENDINRIRSDRDNLNAKLSIFKTEKGRGEVMDNYKMLTETLQKRIADLEEIQLKSLETLSSDDHNKILVNELKQIETAFKSAREIANTKLLTAQEQEQLVNKLSAEKAKADEKYFQAMRTKDALSSQNKILQSNLSKQMDLIEILKKNEQDLSHKLSIEEKIYNNLTNIEKNHVKEMIKLQANFSKNEKQLSKKIENENDLRSQISKYQFELQQLSKDKLNQEQIISSLEKSVKQYKELVTQYRDGQNLATNGRGIGSDSEVQEALLSMTKCSLCKKNFKNVALKTCGHCFCQECVDDRLAARMRKCPSCNCQFSRYDLLTIHL